MDKQAYWFYRLLTYVLPMRWFYRLCDRHSIQALVYKRILFFVRPFIFEVATERLLMTMEDDIANIVKKDFSRFFQLLCVSVQFRENEILLELDIEYYTGEISHIVLAYYIDTM